MSIMSLTDPSPPSLTLSFADGLNWTDRFTSQLVSQSVFRTLGGLPIIFSSPYIKGQSITLESRSDEGWQPYSIVKSLLSMADKIGVVFTFTHDSSSYPVIFRHNDSPAFKAEPAVDKLVYSDDDLFLIYVKLITV